MGFMEPIEFYVDGEAKLLRFHLIDVGEGLMTLIVFPDDTTMLFDCNVRREYRDDILAYLADHIPLRTDPKRRRYGRWIDVFVNSHRDQDHYRGLSDLNEAFPVRSIWDSGQTGATNRDDGYEFYMRLRRSVRETYGHRALVVPVPSSTPIVSFGGAEVYCLCSSKEFESQQIFEPVADEVFECREPKIQHTNCLALAIHYAGRAILLTGDTDRTAWKEKIVPKFGDTRLLRTNVLVASHHGSRSFFRDDQGEETIFSFLDFDYLGAIKRIRPSLTLISCGDYDSNHHPNKEALEIYEDRTAHGQVYTTKEHGTFTGLIDSSGRWSVTPARFRSSRERSGPSLDIRCRYGFFDDKELTSGGSVEIGTTLEFSVAVGDGLLDPDDRVQVEWEVSEGGVNGDHERQALHVKPDPWFFSSGKYKFSWEARYEGRHLVRCRVVNSQRNIDITRIFVVNAVR